MAAGDQFFAGRVEKQSAAIGCALASCFREEDNNHARVSNASDRAENENQITRSFLSIDVALDRLEKFVCSFPKRLLTLIKKNRKWFILLFFFHIDSIYRESFFIAIFCLSLGCRSFLRLCICATFTGVPCAHQKQRDRIACLVFVFVESGSAIEDFVYYFRLIRKICCSEDRFRSKLMRRHLDRLIFVFSFFQ